MDIIGTDGPRDDDVLILYEDRDDHINAESGQLPIRMKVEAVIEFIGLCHLGHTGHTVQIKSYDTLENDIVQDPRYSDCVLAYI